MQHHNNNNADGIQQVHTKMRYYLFCYGNGAERVYSSQGLDAISHQKNRM